MKYIIASAVILLIIICCCLSILFLGAFGYLADYLDFDSFSSSEDTSYVVPTPAPEDLPDAPDLSQMDSAYETLLRITEAEIRGFDANDAALMFRGITEIPEFSIDEDAPTFGSAQSASNIWDHIQIKDLEDGSTIDGDTGFTVAGADDYRMFEVNTNGLTWITANVTAKTEGEVTVIATLFDNK